MRILIFNSYGVIGCREIKFPFDHILWLRLGGKIKLPLAVVMESKRSINRLWPVITVIITITVSKSAVNRIIVIWLYGHSKNFHLVGHMVIVIINFPIWLQVIPTSSKRWSRLRSSYRSYGYNLYIIFWKFDENIFIWNLKKVPN